MEGLITEIVNKEAFKGVSARSPAKPNLVAGAVEALAKALFNNMFNWLVAKMNLQLLPEES